MNISRILPEQLYYQCIHFYSENYETPMITMKIVSYTILKNTVIPKKYIILKPIISSLHLKFNIEQHFSSEYSQE